MIKSMPKWLKILCVGALVACFCFICIFLCTKPHDIVETITQVEENPTEDFENNPTEKFGNLIETNTYMELFKGDTDVDNYYLIGDTGYHIVISNNSITVNDNVVFKVDTTLLNVALYRDLLVIYSSNSSEYTSNFTLVDMNGNVIKSVENALISYNFYRYADNKLSYAVDDYQFGSLDGNTIYNSHEVKQYFISYSGNSDISESISEYSTFVYTPKCLNDKCVLYEQDGLKIEIDSKSARSMYINGNKVDKDYSLLKIEFLPDYYLFITSCGMDGFGELTYITDWNGNVITNFTNIVGDDYYASHPLISDVSNSFSDGIFTINTVSVSAQREAGRYFESHDVYSEDYVIGKVWKFNYLGNGLVDNGYVDEIIDLGDFRNYYNSKSN